MIQRDLAVVHTRIQLTSGPGKLPLVIQPMVPYQVWLHVCAEDDLQVKETHR
jgi:hypothetical protein